MSINPVVAAHLQEARRELMEQREQLDRDISQLDSMLQGYGGDGHVAVKAQLVKPSSRGPAPAMKDAIIELLSSEDREFSTHEVAVALNDRYGWELSSTRSLISKMGKAREIMFVRRGVYRAITPEALNAFLATHRDASDSAHGAESEVQLTASEKGGESNLYPDEDHGDDLDRRNRDDRSGAPVGDSAE